MAVHQPEAWRRIAMRNGISEAVPPALARSQGPNAVHTTRYNLLTWLPKSLYQQFHRLANVYYVLVATLACTPLWHGRWESKVITVVFILLAQAFKDGYEDLKRRFDDHEENTRLSSRCVPSVQVPEELPWKSCTVGDVLLIGRSQPLPCDVLVLASADASGAFYVSTKSLDGETSLKEGKVEPSLSGAVESIGEAEVPGHIVKDLDVHLEEPSPSLLEMSGMVSVDGQVSRVCLSNFALRGSELQNTAWIIGLACYVGDDTKVRLNSMAPPCKTSDLERILNLITTWMLAFIVLVAMFFAVAHCLFQPQTFDQNEETLLFALTRGVDFDVLPGDVDTQSSRMPCIHAFSDYLIIFYSVLPMTLYITYEILHVLIAQQIESDDLMLFDGQKAKARNTSVIEELGQVDYIFSDKTGTLTSNEMRFASCCIGETLVGPFLPVHGSEQSPSGAEALQVMLRGSCAAQTSDFLKTLALCHTVKCDESGSFQAESPDELALVQAAAQAGFSFLGHSTSGRETVYRVHCPSGTHEHVVTHVLGFTSDRKRMSVIYRSESGEAIVMTKGADNVMCRLLASPLPSSAQHALEDFSRQGLRTLIVAQRRMGAEEYAAWATRWETANVALSDREEQLQECAAAAEMHLQYLGITAVEDRLQEGVPETIALLREAGIRVWILTGDKVETAVEIAKSCRLFEENLRVLWAVGATSADDAISSLTDSLPVSECTRCAMVLDGQSVEHILASRESGVALHRLAQRATSCVCCRLSPMQKKSLVKLVREQNARCITLSIGDGANDVPMIQGAHIGIGIRGKEGSAAVQASDFAISQFRFLRNLLLCHGRRAYKRIATFLCFFMYKSAMLSCSYIIYAHTVNFAGRMAFPEGLDMVFNPLTSTAAIIIFATDTDCPDAIALQSPQLYSRGQQRTYMNLPVVSRWLLVGMVHGVIAWCVPVGILTHAWQRITQHDGYWEASFAAFTTIFVLVHAKLAQVAERPMKAIGVAAVLVETLAYIPVVAFLVSPLSQHLGDNLFGVPQRVLTSWSLKQPTPLLCILIVPCLALAAEAMTAAAIQYCTRLVSRATRGQGAEDATAELTDIRCVRD